MPTYLETTADKFTFRVATDRLYTPGGVWVLPELDGKRIRVGLADYVQQHSGDVAFANMKPLGTLLKAGECFAEIETIKTMAEIRAPVGGIIVEINPALESGPEVINQAPYEAGWLAVIEPCAWEPERSSLLDPAAYLNVMRELLQEDLKRA
jgi:glycine cleavage system H protein